MRIWRSVLLMIAFAAGGVAVGFLFSCLNGGFALADTRYHLKWSMIGLLGGLALGVLGFLIAWGSLRRRGGALTGLCVGAAVGPAAFVVVGLMSTPAEVPGPGDLGFAAFLGGLLFMRVGLSLGGN